MPEQRQVQECSDNVLGKTLDLLKRKPPCLLRPFDHEAIRL
jgi:hypothetical protein